MESERKKILHESSSSVNDGLSIVGIQSQGNVPNNKNMRKNQLNADIAKKRIGSKAETVTWSAELVPCVAMVCVDNTNKSENDSEIIEDAPCSESSNLPTMTKSMRKKMNARKRAAEKLEIDEASAKRMKTDDVQGIEALDSSTKNVGKMDVDSTIPATAIVASNDTGVICPADVISNTNTAVSSSHLNTDAALLTPVLSKRAATTSNTTDMPDKTNVLSNKSPKMITTITPLNTTPNKHFAAAVAAAALKLEAAAAMKLEAAAAMKAADAIIAANAANILSPTVNGKNSRKKSNAQNKNEIVSKNGTAANMVISTAVDCSVHEPVGKDPSAENSTTVVTNTKPAVNLKNETLLNQNSSADVSTSVVIEKSISPEKIVSSDYIPSSNIITSTSSSTSATTSTSIKTGKKIISPISILTPTVTPKLEVKANVSKTKIVQVAEKATTATVSVADIKIPDEVQVELQVEVAALSSPVIPISTLPLPTSTTTPTATPAQSKNSRKKLNARKKLELALIANPIEAAKALTDKAAEIQKAAMANYVKQKLESDAQNNMKYRPVGSSSTLDAAAIAADYQMKFGDNNSNRNQGNVPNNKEDKEKGKEKGFSHGQSQNQNQSQRVTKSFSSSSSKVGKYGPPSNIVSNIQTYKNKIDVRKSTGFDKYTYHNQSYGQNPTPYVSYPVQQYNNSQYSLSNFPSNQYQSNSQSQVPSGIAGGSQLYNGNAVGSGSTNILGEGLGLGYRNRGGIETTPSWLQMQQLHGQQNDISSYPDQSQNQNQNQNQGRGLLQAHGQGTQASQFDRYVTTQGQSYVHPNPQSYNGNNVGYSNQMDGAGSSSQYGSSTNSTANSLHPVTGVAQNTMFQTPQQQQPNYQALQSMNSYQYPKSISSSPSHSPVSTVPQSMYGQGQAYASVDPYQNISTGITGYQSNPASSSMYSNAVSLSPYNSNYIPASVYQPTPSLYHTTTSTSSNPYSHGINSK